MPTDQPQPASEGAGTDKFESPEVAAAVELWNDHMHPLTCGGGGGRCSGVTLDLTAANPHAFLLECPTCGRQQFEPMTGSDSIFAMVTRYAAQHDPKTCWTCKFALTDGPERPAAEPLDLIPGVPGASVHDGTVLREAMRRAAEVLDCHACISGDCPHDGWADCEAAIIRDVCRAILSPEAAAVERPQDEPPRELSDAAKEALRELGNYEPTVHHANREVKGWAEGEDGPHKGYLNSDDLRRLATGLNDAANWLDARASAAAPSGAPAPRFSADDIEMVRFFCRNCNEWREVRDNQRDIVCEFCDTIIASYKRSSE